MKPSKLLIFSLAMLLAAIWDAGAKKPKTTLDILTSVPMWVHDCSTHGPAIGSELFFSFEKKTGRQIIYTQGMKMLDLRFNYYLSDDKVEKYEEGFEGKVKNGRYIVMKVTEFDKESPFYKLLKEQGGPNPDSPPMNYKIINSESGKIVLLVGEDLEDEFVPLQGSLEEEQNKLEKIRTEIARKEQQAKRSRGSQQ